MKLDRHKLRELRRSRKITGLKLAAEVGIHQTTYSKIENGAIRASAKLIKRIAAALGVEPSEICVDDPDAIREKAAALSGDAIILQAVELMLKMPLSDRARALGAIAEIAEKRKMDR